MYRIKIYMSKNGFFDDEHLQYAVWYNGKLISGEPNTSDNTKVYEIIFKEV